MIEPSRGHLPLNLHLQHLSYLREIARAPSWTEAAARLGVSQSALSQGVAELERRLGLSLSERRGRRRALTADGLEVAGFAREMLGRAEALRRRLDARRRGDAGTLRVGMIDAASLYVLPDGVRRFRSQYPDVHLRVTVAASNVLLERLSTYRLDLAFVTGPREAPELELLEIQNEPLSIYGPGDAELDEEDADWVLYPEGSQTRDLIDAGLARRGIRPRVTLQSGNPEVLRQMVALGLGWTVLPQAVARAASTSAPLRVQGEPIAERKLLAAWRREAAADPRRDHFLDLARRYSRSRG